MNTKKILAVVVLILLIILVAVYLKKEKSKQLTKINIYDNQIIAIHPKKTANFVQAKTIIQNQLSEKYKILASDISIKPNIESEKYFRGNISIFGKSNGIVLAMKKNGIWQIVYDGKENFICELVSDLKFPDSMLKGCKPLNKQQK